MNGKLITTAISLLLLIGVNSIAGAKIGQYLPEGTTFALYVKNPANLEANLKKYGLFTLDEEYRQYLLSYLEKDSSFIKMYKQFRDMENGDFLKSMMGDMIIFQSGSRVMFMLRASKNSKFFTGLMSTVNAGGKFKGYYVGFTKGFVLFSRSRSFISYYKNQIASQKTLQNKMVTKLEKKNYDVILFRKGYKIIDTFVDSILFGSGVKLSVAVGINLKKKTISAYTSNPAKRTSGMKRLTSLGLFVPSNVVSFVDVAKSPAEVFSKIFGVNQMSRLKRPFEKYFYPQMGIGMLSLSKNATPSFMLVMQTTQEQRLSAITVMKQFLKQVVGDTRVSAMTMNNLNVYKGNKSGLMFYSIKDFIILTDSRLGLESPSLAYRAQIPSIWFRSETQKLKKLIDKDSAYFFDFHKFGVLLYDSMTFKMKLRKGEKNDIKEFVSAIKNLGVLVGYQKAYADYQYYHMMLKPSTYR